MISHRQVGTTDHRRPRAATDGSGKARAKVYGSIDFFSATTATIRYGQGHGRDGLKKKEEKEKKDTIGKWQQDQIFSALVYSLYIQTGNRISTYTRGPD